MNFQLFSLSYPELLKIIIKFVPDAKTFGNMLLAQKVFGTILDGQDFQDVLEKFLVSKTVTYTENNTKKTVSFSYLPNDEIHGEFSIITMCDDRFSTELKGYFSFGKKTGNWYETKYNINNGWRFIETCKYENDLLHGMLYQHTISPKGKTGLFHFVPYRNGEIHGTVSEFREANFSRSRINGLQTREYFDGVFHGMEKEWWDSTGELSFVRWYEMGKAVGVSLHYDEQGIIIKDIPVEEQCLLSTGLSSAYFCDRERICDNTLSMWLATAKKDNIFPWFNRNE